MTTEKLYENDSYITTFQATVWPVCRQIRYVPGKMGRKADGQTKVGDSGPFVLTGPHSFRKAAARERIQGGWMRGPVWDVQIIDGALWHRTDLEAKEGQALQGRIDWQRRFSNMQQHSGEHIFSV